MTRQVNRVMDTTTTTGTGNITLSGTPVAGFTAFGSRISVNDPFDYCIEAVDSNGLPTGDWEIGEGYLSASTTLVRYRVTDSSNAGALVNFAAGTKRVFVTLPSDEIADIGNVIGLHFGYFAI